MIIFKAFETPIWHGKQNSLTGPVITGSFEKRAPGTKAGTRLGNRCLDGCYGNRGHREALCDRSHWRREKGERRKMKGWENEKGGWERLNKQLTRSMLQTVRVRMIAAREGRPSCASEATPDRGVVHTPIRLFAANDHMVQNPPCWRASSLLFPHWDIKTKASQAWLVEVSLF